MPVLTTTRMSSSGQVVIPEAVRRKLKLKAGTEFVVFGGGDAIMLKAVSGPRNGDFDAVAASLRRYARRTGLKPADIRGAARGVRAEEKENAFWLKEAEKALADAKRRGEKPIPFEEAERELDAARANRRGAEAPRKRARAAR